MRWTNSSRGTKPVRYGSRWSWLFLSAFLAFLPSSLWPQSQPAPASQQTQPSTQYSKMTQAELLKLIEQKDSLLAEWLTWHDKVTTSQAELARTSADQLASRDKLIADQGIVIAERTKERDDALAEVNRQKVMGWLEKLLYGFGGASAGYAVGHFVK